MKTEVLFSHEENGKKFYKMKCLEDFTLFNITVEAGTVGDFYFDEDSEIRDSWIIGYAIVTGSYIEYSMLVGDMTISDSLLRSVYIAGGSIVPTRTINQAELNKVEIICLRFDIQGESPTKRVMLNSLRITRNNITAI